MASGEKLVLTVHLSVTMSEDDLGEFLRQLRTFESGRTTVHARMYVDAQGVPRSKIVEIMKSVNPPLVLQEFERQV